MEVDEAIRRMRAADTYRDRHWDAAVSVTDGKVRTAGAGWLRELLRGLLAVPGPTYPMRYGFTAALRRLALDAGSAQRVVEVRGFAAAGERWGEVGYEGAEVAEWLASGQALESILPVLAEADPADELAACLLQEAALRHDLTGSPAEAFAERLRAAGHPLAGLPLRRTEAERTHGMPHYAGLPRPARHRGSGTPAPGPAGLAVGAAEVPWPGADRALTAHRTWSQSEVRLFRLDRRLAPEEFGASVLSRLDLECVAGTRAAARRVGTADVLRTLYSGTGGGVYGRSLFGAYGRLASWQALAALAGSPDTAADVAGIEEVADACTWLAFTAPSGWYLEVHDSLDIGIAALRPDRRSVAVLACTDSD